MKTPIFDFIESYRKKSPIRMHMPGHKGQGGLGAEALDITEISGADVLYHASGIIKESMNYTSLLFGSKKTLFSTEGCTLAIRTMLALAAIDAKEKGQEPIILSSRAAHKSFLTSAALLDITPQWITVKNKRGLISQQIEPEDLEDYLKSCPKKPTALYLTSPDYLGQMADITEISKICRREGILLLIDNAHGAYLHFLPEPCHPLDLGADMACDSAHKTLPVLTGGAYLHLGNAVSDSIVSAADGMMSLFASTSPSYLILQSLDLANAYLADGYSRKLYEFAAKLYDLKKELRRMGFVLIEKEPLKITVEAKASGYLGTELAAILEKNGIFCEFADPDFLVLMLTPENTEAEMQALLEQFRRIKPKEPILKFPPHAFQGETALPPKEALFSPSEEIQVENAIGRVLSEPGITCPPAVPIALCGEILTAEHITAFRYYGIETLRVIK